MPQYYPIYDLLTHLLWGQSKCLTLPALSINIFAYFFYWKITALQYCVGFCHTQHESAHSIRIYPNDCVDSVFACCKNVSLSPSQKTVLWILSGSPLWTLATAWLMSDLKILPFNNCIISLRWFSSCFHRVTPPANFKKNPLSPPKRVSELPTRVLIFSSDR